jgi:WD40 repeat protein
VLLLSADFLASDFIYDEELKPLLKEARNGAITLVIIPITASPYETTLLEPRQFVHPPDKPLDGMPEHERNAAFVRIVKEIAKAAQRAALDITSQPAPVPGHTNFSPLASVVVTGQPGALHGVPGQRSYHISRAEYFEPLKRAVLGTTHQAIGVTGATPAAGEARIGLHGMGGIGKTVLAIDLVNDDEVRRAFPDGIFWLTLGQAVEPLRLQGELAGYLAGEAKAYATLNEARDQLRQLFQNKACLLVLDDLWRRQDAEPFDVLGPRSRLLVTTRDADLLVALGAREMPLDVLGEEAALELLASWSGQPRGKLPPAARKVVESCGHLPLALALAGARVQGGARWEELLSALQRGRLEFLDHPYGSVFSSLRLSTDALPETDRARYFEMAVFPEDAEIPVETICTLWRHTGAIEPEASRDLLRRLQRRGLLIRNDDGHISFHDLQHDFLRLNIASLVDGNRALVEAHRATAPSGWASGPDDGYFFQHLPQHLAAADRLDEVKALLCNYDWLSAKLRVTDITAVIADYELTANDPDLTLVHRALRLSIPALAHDTSQLPSQLLGRLRGEDSSTIRALLAGAENATGSLWLCPRFGSLTRPDDPLGQILVGHTSCVIAVGVLAGENRALSGSLDNTLRLWDIATGKTLRVLEGHTEPVSGLAWLADGRGALSASWDGTLRLWNLITGETMRVFEGHTSSVNAVTVLAGGRHAISGSTDNTLRLWDIATGTTVRVFEGHTNRVTAVAVVPDGSRALSSSFDGTMRLWDLATGNTLRIFLGHTSEVSAVAVLRDGSRALSGSFDGTMRLWDLETGNTLRLFEGHTDWVTAVAGVPDGSRALSGSADSTMRLWDLETGKPLRVFAGHTAVVAGVTAFDGGNNALSGSWDQTMRIWDLGARETRFTLERHTGGVRAVVIHADGSRALSGSNDSTLRLWNLSTGKILRTFEGHTAVVSAVALFTDGGHALSGSHDGTLRLWDLASGETLRTLSAFTNSVTAVAVFANGSRALSGSERGTLRLWDLATGRAVRTLDGHTREITAVTVLPDQRTAVSASKDGTLRVWELERGTILRTFEGHAKGMTAAAVQPDGSRALAGSDDGSLRLWDLATGRILRILEGHADSITSVTVLDNGRLALSGSRDRAVLLWDLETASCRASFTTDAMIMCIAGSQDNFAIAGSLDGKIHVLEIREH